MFKVASVSDVRSIEQLCFERGISQDELMENAGRGVARKIISIVGHFVGCSFLFLIGPGNNGGDGLVAARYLASWGARVSLYLTSPRSDFSLKKIGGGVRLIDPPGLAEALGEAQFVVDAILGTGQHLPLKDEVRAVLGRVAEEKRRKDMVIFALDLPTGLDGDSGMVDEYCLYCDYTITLGLAKKGLFSHPALERAGQIEVIDIGIPEEFTGAIGAAVLDESWAREVLPARPRWANKGTFGRLLIIAGSKNYLGAPYLAASGALRSGAGLVSLAVPESLVGIIASKLGEATFLPLEEKEGSISPRALDVVKERLSSYDALVIGPGLGQEAPVAEFLTSLLSYLDGLPVVIDADGLNILSRISSWWEKVPTLIVTPHPGEMARLSGLKIDEIQSNRLDICQKMAIRWHKVVVLKGAYSAISSPEGEELISPFAVPALATAGTGDVLSGVIGSFLAQKVKPFEAAALGVFIHGWVGDMIGEVTGAAGSLAGDLPDLLPWAIKDIRESAAGD